MDSTVDSGIDSIKLTSLAVSTVDRRLVLKAGGAAALRLERHLLRGCPHGEVVADETPWPEGQVDADCDDERGEVEHEQECFDTGKVAVVALGKLDTTVDRPNLQKEGGQLGRRDRSSMTYDDADATYAQSRSECAPVVEP